jgi:hypothetical protein
MQPRTTRTRTNFEGLAAGAAGGLALRACPILRAAKIAIQKAISGKIPQYPYQAEFNRIATPK